tara:strand:+ start:51147 stop:51398 length:252 start_codon:yes stop_codon:yes gene_type:complete
MPFKFLKDKNKYMKKYNQKTVNLRVLRNKARRKKEKEGKVKKGDGKHVHHIKPLSQGGGNGDDNTQVVDAQDNRKKYNETGKA